VEKEDQAASGRPLALASSQWEEAPTLRTARLLDQLWSANSFRIGHGTHSSRGIFMLRREGLLLIVPAS